VIRQSGCKGEEHGVLIVLAVVLIVVLLVRSDKRDLGAIFPAGRPKTVQPASGTLEE
jgi:preprotein translocase subunit SecG